MMLRRLLCSGLAAVLPWFIIGCGGGTGGTGVNNFQGTVSTADRKPLAGGILTIVKTGEATSTDVMGNFEITSDVKGKEVDFELVKDNIHTTFTVKKREEDQSRINIQIRLNEEEQATEVQAFALRAGMIGDCKKYFRNDLVIEQKRHVSPRSRCRVQALVHRDGHRIADIPVAIQYRSCIGNTKSEPRFGVWNTITTGRTMGDPSAGFVEIEFPFIDNDTYCEYRVVAPFRYEPYAIVAFPIQTFTFKRKNG